MPERTHPPSFACRHRRDFREPARCKFPAFAAAPPAGTQAPGFYRYKVGSIEITVVTDGVNRLPVTDEFVTNVKKEEVKRRLQPRT